MSHLRTFLLPLFFVALFCVAPLALQAQETESAAETPVTEETTPEAEKPKKTEEAAKPKVSGELAITPVVIDEKAKARDILKQSVTITNTSSRKLNLYPSVNDVHSVEGTEEFVSAQNATDRAASLANWIELSRGVIEIDPGEEKTIPFVIRVNLSAVPGTYHATVGFSEGGDRETAQEKGALTTLTVNVEVQADIKEVMQLNKFMTDNIFFSGDDVLFNYQLENLGNQDLQPKGEIRIYNRKGAEVASIEVNGEGKKVSPEQMAQLASVWNGAEGFGKFKAFLNVNYGSSQTASVQDTVFFWIVPWKQLLGLFIASLIAIIFFALYFHKWFEQRHLRKLAAAGQLNHAAMDVVHEEPVPATPVSADRPRRKKGLFAFFKREKKDAPVMAPEHSDEPQTPGSYVPLVPPLPPHHAPKRSLREAFGTDETLGVHGGAQAQRAPAHGETINLKAMQQSRAQGAVAPTASAPALQAHSHGHVINLKKMK